MMVWISSMKRMSGKLLQLRQHGLQALLEVAAVFGTGDQRAQIERIDGRIGQHFGDVAVDDALGQSFGDRGLAHAGLADVKRIVLAPAAQHLDGALDLVDPADQQVDPAFARELIEIDREFGQSVALAFTLPAHPDGSRCRPDARARHRPAWRCHARGS